MATKGFDLYGEDAFPIIIRLIKENPEYDKLYVALRHIVSAKHVANQDEGEMTTNRLISLLYNYNVSVEEFVDAIREEREMHSLVWTNFKNQISKLG